MYKVFSNFLHFQIYQAEIFIKKSMIGLFQKHLYFVEKASKNSFQSKLLQFEKLQS